MKDRPGHHLMAVFVFITGPAATIDTACSSSLSSVALAGTLMRAGGCGRAVAAAALLTLDPRTIGALAAAAMLAPDGRCKTNDAAADGYEYSCYRTTFYISLSIWVAWGKVVQRIQGDGDMQAHSYLLGPYACGVMNVNRHIARLAGASNHSSCAMSFQWD